MNTPMEIARENYFNRRGYYPEDLIKEHPCYSCKYFHKECGVPDDGNRCEEYKEEE